MKINGNTTYNQKPSQLTQAQQYLNQKVQVQKEETLKGPKETQPPKRDDKQNPITMSLGSKLDLTA